MGPVYHIDHDGSFINTKHTYQPGYADAPFGPDWNGLQPFWNREDWGVRPAIEEPRGHTTWLRTPEEAGPVLSLLLHGRGDATARAAAVSALLGDSLPIELVVVDPESALVAALDRHRRDARLRLLDASDVGPGTPLGSALRIASACAHGRHLVYVPGAVTIDGLGTVVARLSDAGADAIVHGVGVDADVGGAASNRALTIVSRRALERLDGIDALTADPIEAFARRARRQFGVTVIEGASVRPLPSLDPVSHDPAIDAAWSSLGDGGIVSAVVAADLTRRGELLTVHVRDRLARELPADARDVAVFGLGPLTPFAMAAVRSLGRHLVGVFAPGADGNTACAGLTVRPAGELWPSPTLWVAAACTSPADVAALLAQVPIELTVHLVEPASLRPDAPAFLTATPFEGLLHARGLRTAGALREAEAAYRAVLRDPSALDAGSARYELALVQEQLGRPREAETGLRWAFRHWPEERALIAYNLGSLYERQQRWPQAQRAFMKALRLAPPHDRARRGGCEFHLGEIALAMGDEVRARTHFANALEAQPSHGKARARLGKIAVA